jgi:predicted DNA-binding ribbon-helix-helix protein
MAYEQRSMRLNGQRRCLRLEPEFWHMLERIARLETEALPGLIDRINRHRAVGQGIGSAIRCYVIRYFVERARGTRASH